ncbi:PIN/TRAM domain-containing protein [Desemzia sp. RIT804]|uniref:PIN/TRAM domain-containing protein n=1 Tax=Desemzia sp. RIT 804 TaxID=2810209 RepID=UPI001950FFF2|nr:PIN/TRAM domain-containing protein [Desemzia sp. RIT 804]MBM6615191.1 PIN/TRAM domain-containing protein [Desemzia sp. RIT 804]
MKKKIISLVFVLIGGSIGATFLPLFWEIIGVNSNLINNIFTNILIGALISYLLSLTSVKYVEQALRKAEEFVSQLSLTYLIAGSIGTIIGLLLAWLINISLISLGWPIVSNVVPMLVTIFLAYFGFRVGTTRRQEIRILFQSKPKQDVEEQDQILERNADDNFRKYKILDTSVIIDGRVYDIVMTGFLEGTILIPNFVLHELQHIADSSDSLKRVRGRRGLDILNALQKEEGLQVENYDGDFKDIEEVDAKLVKLAKLLDGVVVTNDYNLNKVCEFQNVPVLNINELANAVKPVVIPGETMIVTMVKAGTERTQGVAYLDDGTMVVVEEGQHYMNKTIEVVVTSALQTAAGRMIFAKPANAQKKLNDKE